MNDDEYIDESPDQDSPDEKTFTQSQLDKILANRLPEYEGYKSKASQFDELTQSTEDTLASVRAQAESAQAELAWRDVLLERQQIAATKGLDPALWSRVKGETKDEIEADINELVSFSAPAATRKSSHGAFSSGASSGNGKQTDKERAAEALRGIRQR